VRIVIHLQYWLRSFWVSDIIVVTVENLLYFYQNSDGKTKKKILSCIFSEKIHFDENKVAAISFHKPIEVLLNASKVL